MEYDLHQARLRVELPLLCNDVLTVSISASENNTIQYSFLPGMLENNMFIEWWYDLWTETLNTDLLADKLSTKFVTGNKTNQHVDVVLFKTVARLHICIPEIFRHITYLFVEESLPLHPLNLRDKIVSCIRTFCSGNGYFAEKRLVELSASGVEINNWNENEIARAKSIEGFDKLRMIKTNHFNQKLSQLEVTKWMESQSESNVLSRCKAELKVEGKLPPFPEYKKMY